MPDRGGGGAGGPLASPLFGSSSSEVKNDYAYVITQDICNKFIEVNFYVGCVVLQPNRL